MPKKSPKQQPQPPADATAESVQTPTPAPAKPKAQPLTINKESLPPAAAQRAREFYKDSADIEGAIWRSIYD